MTGRRRDKRRPRDRPVKVQSANTAPPSGELHLTRWRPDKEDLRVYTLGPSREDLNFMVGLLAANLASPEVIAMHLPAVLPERAALCRAGAELSGGIDGTQHRLGEHH